ncbi:uncharacterized protein LOC144095180 [Amblyomma americanum]
MPSFAEARFRSDSWLLLLSGCLPPFRGQGDLRPERRSRWRYTMLTVAVVVTVTSLELAAFEGRSRRHGSRMSHFNGDLFFSIRVLMFVKVISQLAAMLAKSHDTWALVAQATEYERTRRQQDRRRSRAFKTAYRALYLLVVTTFFTTRWHVFLVRLHAFLPVLLSALLSIATVAAAFAVAVWDSAPGILAKCFAEVFVHCLRVENMALSAAASGQVLVVDAGRCRCGGARERDDLRAVLGECRANVEAVVRMLGDAQKLLGTLLLLSFGANMGVVCAVLYALTDSSSPASLLFSGTMYAGLNFANALDIAFASESLATEITEMKWTLRSLPFQGHPDEFARDVRSFHEILDPSSMFLSAHGFFRVNLAQMVSMGAAVITYTVILIQSSQEVKT